MSVQTDGAGGSTETQQGGGGADVTSDAGQGPSVAELQAQLNKFQGRIKELSDENAKHRNAAKQNAEQARTAAEAQGNFKALYEEASKKLGEFEPIVKEAEELRTGLGERVEARKGKLSPTMQMALDAIPSLSKKMAFLDALDAEAGQAPTKQAAPLPKQGSPAGSPIDIDAELSRGVTLAEIRQKYPAEYAKYKEQWTPRGSGTTAARTIFAGRT